MTQHMLKCYPQYFKAVKDGTKPFECRYNDRDFKVGDELLLREYEPQKGYTSRCVVRFRRLKRRLCDFRNDKRAY
ncbi:hypothetical protein FMV2238Y02_03340 [Streptococcus canis]|uniref:DUF3850 domain-containing protein n=1 Tax=Streptococcus canis TaxID=1329 RepID=A0A2D4DP62_STRCB|nr:uncharacterized protein TANIYAMA4_1029 [Streptococcus canis]GFK30058.1 hypothetical protein ScFU149_01750 [Streptococcus canis]VDC41917.1 hypothetical protein FMV2238Y02_03340 [Streptococcus canis]